MRPAIRDFWSRKTLAALISVHEARFLFYLAKPVNEILGQARRPAYLQFEQETALNTAGEQMRRFYRLDETRVRLKNYSNYYAGMPETHWANFPNLSVFPITQKRKKRYFKTHRRGRGAAENAKNAQPRRSVLKNLNRRTMYLEDIEVEASHVAKEKPSDVLAEEDLQDRERPPLPVHDGEVHDIFNPRFSSNDETEDDLKGQLVVHSPARPPYLGHLLNVSIRSRDLLDPEQGESVCSYIRGTGGQSIDLIVEDFSELIGTRNRHLLEASKDGRNSPDSDGPDGPDGSQGPGKKTQRRCPPLAFKLRETVDSQNETKGASIKATPRQTGVQSNLRAAKPFFGTTHNQSRGQGSDRNSLGLSDLKKKPSVFTFGQKGSKGNLFSSSSKKLVINPPSRPVPDHKKVSAEEPRHVGSQTEARREVGRPSEHPLPRLRSKSRFSDYETGRKRNSFNAGPLLCAPTPVKTIKFSLKEGETLHPRPQHAKFSFKKKETGALFRNLPKRLPQTQSRKLLLEIPTTPRNDRELLKSKLLSGAAWDRSKKMAGTTCAARPRPVPQLFLKSNYSLKSLAGQREDKLSFTMAKKELRGGRWLHADEYDYYTGDRNSIGAESGKQRDSLGQGVGRVSQFGKKTSLASIQKLPSKTSTEDTTKKRTSSRDLLGQIREKFFGKIGKNRPN